MPFEHKYHPDYKYLNRLERKLDHYNHIMELVRTIVPVIVLGLQIIILWKLGS